MVPIKSLNHENNSYKPLIKPLKVAYKRESKKIYNR